MLAYRHGRLELQERFTHLEARHGKANEIGGHDWRTSGDDRWRFFGHCPRAPPFSWLSGTPEPPPIPPPVVWLIGAGVFGALGVPLGMVGGLLLNAVRKKSKTDQH